MKSNGRDILFLGMGAVAVLLALPGCSKTFRVDPVRLDQHFGEAVKTVRTAQVADPQAAANPAPDAPNSLNGERGQRVIRDYIRGGQQSQRIGMPTISIGTIGGSGGGSGGGGGGGDSGGGGGF